MRKLILRSLNAHRSRLVLTMVAIGISVSFVTASFVLSDSLRGVFGELSDEIYSSVDAEIRAGEGDFDTLSTGNRFDENDIDGVADIEGVSEVLPVLEANNAAFTVDADGNPLRPTGPPTKVFSSFEGSEASPFTIVSGVSPAAGEIMLDTAQADELDVTEGDTVTVTTESGAQTFTLSGTLMFGDEEIGISPYFLVFDMATAQELLDADGQISNALVSFDDGVSFDDIRDTVSAELPDSLIVVDQETLVEEQNSEFSTIIDLVQIGLLAFAGITLFVSTFVIANTFAVIVGQQRRQIGLLRAIGARTNQAVGVVLAEALLVGLIASIVGVFGGIGLAIGIQELIGLISNGGFPEGSIDIRVRTVIIAVVLGIGVTVVSALLPARRAGQVTPLEAMGSGSDIVEDSSGRGFIYRFLTATIGRFGASGKLAVTGIARNPRRILSTGMSMIIGLALISMMSVLTTSYRSTLDDLMSNGFDADVVVVGSDDAELSYDTVDAIYALDEVQAASGYGSTEVLYDGDVVSIMGFEPEQADGVVVLDAEPAIDSPLAAGDAYVSSDFVDEQNLAAGSALAVEFSDGYTADLTVAAVLDNSTIATSDVMVDEILIGEHARNTDAQLAAVRFADSVDATTAMAAVQAVLDEQPQLEMTTVDDYIADQQAQVDTLMGLVTGLLALAIVVALTGIANTVALGALERRSEFGLLRAVGMSRRQMSRMVRLESLVIAVFGAVTGTAAGVTIAAIITAFVPSNFISSLQIPVTSLVVYVAVCIVFGVIAAALPARRTARSNILDVIAAPE